MPVRLLQSLSVAERGVSFQDRRFLAIGISKEDDLCNDVSQDGVIVCYSSSTLYTMSYIKFLQALRHNYCNRRERKRNRPFTRPIFLVWRKMVWERDQIADMVVQNKHMLQALHYYALINCVSTYDIICCHGFLLACKNSLLMFGNLRRSRANMQEHNLTGSYRSSCPEKNNLPIVQVTQDGVPYDIFHKRNVDY